MFDVLGYLGRPRASACDCSEADVRGDGVQPGGELRARLITVGALPRAQHCLLERVVRVVERAQHSVAVEVERPAVWLDQERERLVFHRWGTLLGTRTGRVGAELCPHPGLEGAG
jgi:hypothetical protein